MKKLILALTAVAALTGPALAADIAARPYTKAPVVAPVANWTGFYVFGGGGAGMWNADTNLVDVATGIDATRDSRVGGHGWFGTVGAGYDWQFNSAWVAGIFADGQFGSLRGSSIRPVGGLGMAEGRETLRTSYAAGVRLGYLVAPNVYSYVNGGYSGSEWSGVSYTGIGFGVAPVFTTPSFSRHGWFIGGGVENSLNIFGINTPGWFMKTEYRSAFYDRVERTETSVATGLPTGIANTFEPHVQTVSTSLVYRFNWGGARY